MAGKNSRIGDGFRLPEGPGITHFVSILNFMCYFHLRRFSVSYQSPFFALISLPTANADFYFCGRDLQKRLGRKENLFWSLILPVVQSLHSGHAMLRCSGTSIASKTALFRGDRSIYKILLVVDYSFEYMERKGL